MTPTEETAVRVCNIPSEFHRRRDTSVFQLVQESGYAEADTSSLRCAVEQQLRTHPTLLDDWLAYCADKRTSSGWYLADDTSFTVGYYDVGHGRSREQRFSDRSEACTEFIMRELEAISERTA